MVSIPVLWLCGPPGAGKTAVAWELYERLQRAGRGPAYLDVDQVGMCYPAPASDPARHRLQARNIAALRASDARAGARGLIVSGVVDADRGPDVDAVGDGAVTVGRLRADADVLLARLRARDASFTARDAVVREADAFDRSEFGDWCVDTTARSVAAVADAVLARIGEWPGPAIDAAPARPIADAGAAPADGEVLWLCGPRGVGKSTVGFRLFLDVVASGIAAAYADADQLAFCGAAGDDPVLRARNVAAVWGGFRAAGARALVVTGPVATRSEVRVYERALPHARVTWCRLHAGASTLAARIVTRGAGGSWAQPGDPLRGRSVDELRAAARRSVADAAQLERHGIGVRVDVDALDADDAATAIRRQTAWPAARSSDRTAR